jgi:HAD superfamily phosphoserine phosphatase-like hydrolase
MTRLSEARTQVAAFFDVDGTILARPSLERRFFAMLRCQRVIPAQNYLLWLAHAVQLAPRGFGPMAHANKMYLRGVSADGNPFFPESGTTEPEMPALRRYSSRAPLRVFFPQAMERIAWHAAQEHSVVLVTGTLAPLAREVALALVLRLAVRGITTSVGVCATRLEEAGGRWTGRIIGEAMFAEGKMRAAQQLATKAGFDLARSYAYGDTASDRWLLGAVGQPVAVNPSRELQRIARMLDWPVLWWKQEIKEDDGTMGFTSAASARSENLG